MSQENLVWTPFVLLIIVVFFVGSPASVSIPASVVITATVIAASTNVSAVAVV